MTLQTPDALPGWTMSERRDIAALWSDMLNVSSASLVSYPSGSLVFSQGDFVHHAHLLRSGLVKLSCMLPEGTETIVTLAAAGQFIGHVSSDQNRYQPATATAVLETALYRIDVTQLEQLLGTNSKAAGLFVRGYELDQAEAFRAILELKKLTTPQRFARLLLWLAEIQSVATTRLPLKIPIPLKDREMAEVLGVSSENFSRLLHRMIHSKDILRINRRIVIISPDLCK